MSHTEQHVATLVDGQKWDDATEAAREHAYALFGQGKRREAKDWHNVARICRQAGDTGADLKRGDVMRAVL